MCLHQRLHLASPPVMLSLFPVLVFGNTSSTTDNFLIPLYSNLIVVSKVPFNPHNPQCPQCSSPCSSDYRCRYCNCNIHVFCCLDFEKTGEMGHGAHYRCSRPECVHAQTTTTVRTSPRIKTASSSRPSEVAPQKLNFISQPAATPLPKKKLPSQYPVSHRNAWADPGNVEAKCSLAKQSKCRNKGDLLRRCVIDSCVQYIHEKCIHKNAPSI